MGGNFRLDAIQAAILNVKLSHLDGWTKRRQKHAARYVELFKASGLVSDGRVTLPTEVYADIGLGHGHIYNQFVIRVHDREKLRQHLTSVGVGTEVYYPVPLHLQECFRELGYRVGGFPQLLPLRRDLRWGTLFSIAPAATRDRYACSKSEHGRAPCLGGVHHSRNQKPPTYLFSVSCRTCGWPSTCKLTLRRVLCTCRPSA